MIIVQKPEQIGHKGIALTTGFFDGVHLGHKSLINKVLEQSRKHNLNSAILTFWPHPRLVLNKDPHKLRFLTTLNEKTKILSNLGFDYFILQEFKPSLATMAPEEYISFVVNSYRVKHFVVGSDHRFGKNAQGDINLLKDLSLKYDFTLDVLDIVDNNDVDISSTKIREALSEGDLQRANVMLGYPYLFTGTIEQGKQIGRQIGFPTANIRPNDPLKLIPAQGVYAVVLMINGKVEQGMLNIGFKPTVNNNKQQTVEVHIFNFDLDIYHQKIEVAFIHRIRDEKKFPDLEHLKNQLELDKVDALTSLSRLNLNDFEKYFLTLPGSKKSN